jgi:beta-lactamase class A
MSIGELTWRWGVRVGATAVLLGGLKPGLGAQVKAAGGNALRIQLREIAAESKGKVSVACSLPGTALDCDLNAQAHAPMQSVFKLPVAIAVLRMVEQGKLGLDQPVRFQPSDLFVPHEYSPLQDKYPKANVDVPLRELLRLAVSESDNAAADILLRLASGASPTGSAAAAAEREREAGAKAVNDAIARLGVPGFHLVDGEHALQRDVNAQYRNWFEPAGAVELMRRIADRSPLTPEHTQLLLGWMRAARLTTRLNGDLPASTIVAHKTGTSGVDNGLAHATNDIGLITLPDGRQLAIAVFLTDSTADAPARDKTIARIARAAYDAASATR